MTKVNAFCHVLPQPYYDRLQDLLGVKLSA